MKSVKKVICVLTLVAALGGIGLARYASAQGVPSCASCGAQLGDCVSTAGQANATCIANCITQYRPGSLGACAQACAQLLVNGPLPSINACKAEFTSCVAGCQ